ncbi:MAG: hypothetical protein EHM58_11835 [Ignavibacteriae bacterium]|nr:MAG: hypothetical protein EHM58_11835 [Ignavibacteriota bacterium]
MLKYFLYGFSFYLLASCFTIISTQSYIPDKNQNDDKNFQFTLEVSKLVFLEVEPIQVVLKIKNVSNSADSLARFDNFREYIKIHNDKHELVLYRPDWDDLMIPRYYVFKPNEEKYLEIDLLSYYCNSYLDSAYSDTRHKYIGKYKFISAGKYTLKLYSHIFTYVSNEITVDIKKPEGEEADAFQILKPLLITNSAREKLDGYFKFLTLYKSSVFYEMAIHTYSLLKSYFESTDSGNLIEVIEPYLIKYPNSKINVDLIEALAAARDKGTQEQKNSINDFIKKLINDYPGTRAANWAIKIFKEH